ncbi:type II toxin-antitoxin system RelE/ParE family toxin, partial [Sinorhizobium meliloti]
FEPSDWKPMASVGQGVREIRIRDEAGAFRVIYITKIEDAVFVLHAFQKKTQQTAKRDLDLAAARLRQIQRRCDDGTPELFQRVGRLGEHAG